MPNKWPADWVFVDKDWRDLMIGDRVPCLLEHQQPAALDARERLAPGSTRCLNCADYGIVASYVITASGAVHWFGDEHHSQRYTKMDIAPCPTCRPESQERALEVSGILSLTLEGKVAPDLSLAYFMPRPGQREAYNECAKIAQNIRRPPNLLLFGPNGTGKTHLLIALCNKAIESGVGVHYTTAKSILERLQATYDPLVRANTDLVRREYENYPILVVDELSGVRWTEWAGEELFGLIEQRHSKGLPTWCAINRSPSMLASEGERSAAIVSRLTAGSVVGIVGEDARAVRLPYKEEE